MTFGSRLTDITMTRYLILFNLCVLTLIAYWGTQTFYKVLSVNVAAGRSAQSIEQTPSAKSEQSLPALEHYNAIAARDLFKIKAAALPKPAAIKVEKLKPTGLKLILRGTVVAQESVTGKAYAVIEEKGRGVQHLYTEGDTVQGASIKAILRQQVVLNVDGHDEILEMANRPLTNTKQDTSAPESAPASLQSQERRTLARTMVEEAAGNINQLLSQVKIYPHFQNGKPDGFRLMNIKATSFF